MLGLGLGYRSEGTAMPYTMADFRRDYILEHFPELSREDRLEILRKLPPEVLLKGLSPEERMEGLSREVLESYLQKLRARQPAPQRKPRRKR